jgi:hypothetical protein
MSNEEPEAKTSLGLFLAPAGAVRALTVGPGEPGPGDEWHLPPEPAAGSAASAVPSAEPPQSPQDEPQRSDK